MRRLALLALLALAHLSATVFFFWLNLWLLFRALNSRPLPAVVDRAAEAVSWALGFPLLTAAYLAEVNLLGTWRLLGLMALNSAVWVAAGVLARRAWTRRRARTRARAAA
ncbi:MAG TPA: hypothetical protein VF615_15505 [Longimicrobiaceae bacterium]|jgi:hypothetical protein